MVRVLVPVKPKISVEQMAEGHVEKAAKKIGNARLMSSTMPQSRRLWQLARALKTGCQPPLAVRAARHVQAVELGILLERLAGAVLVRTTKASCDGGRTEWAEWCPRRKANELARLEAFARRYPVTPGVLFMEVTPAEFRTAGVNLAMAHIARELQLLVAED